MNPQLWRYILNDSFVPSEHSFIDISPCISLCKPPWSTRLVSALMLEEISHDYERHSNVAVFLSLTEIIESEDRVPNIYS